MNSRAVASSRIASVVTNKMLRLGKQVARAADSFGVFSHDRMVQV
jgi:hypothetical protein